MDSEFRYVAGCRIATLFVLPLGTSHFFGVELSPQTPTFPTQPFPFVEQFDVMLTPFHECGGSLEKIGDRLKVVYRNPQKIEKCGGRITAGKPGHYCDYLPFASFAIYRFESDTRVRWLAHGLSGDFKNQWICVEVEEVVERHANRKLVDALIFACIQSAFSNEKCAQIVAQTPKMCIPSPHFNEKLFH